MSGTTAGSTAVAATPNVANKTASSMSPLDISRQGGPVGLLQKESEEMVAILMKTPQPTPSK
jgi:hypothetical protein